MVWNILNPLATAKNGTSGKADLKYSLPDVFGALPGGYSMARNLFHIFYQIC